MEKIKTKILPKKEVALMEYMKKLQLIRHLITLTQLQLKVANITQERLTPFKNGIPRCGDG
jgi:hypothetical protein